MTCPPTGEIIEAHESGPAAFRSDLRWPTRVARSARSWWYRSGWVWLVIPRLVLDAPEHDRRNQVHEWVTEEEPLTVHEAAQPWWAGSVRRDEHVAIPPVELDQRGPANLGQRVDVRVRLGERESGQLRPGSAVVTSQSAP